MSIGLPMLCKLLLHCSELPQTVLWLVPGKYQVLRIWPHRASWSALTEERQLRLWFCRHLYSGFYRCWWCAWRGSLATFENRLLSNRKAPTQWLKATRQECKVPASIGHSNLLCFSPHVSSLFLSQALPKNEAAQRLAPYRKPREGKIWPQFYGLWHCIAST